MEMNAERHSFLPALRYPKYRLLFYSTIGTNIGRWIETAIGAWLVLELTNSPFLVGLLGACRFASMLSGPFCGTISDRLNRRIILLAAQATYGAAALIIFLLFYYSQLEVWHLFVFTLVGGLVYTFDFSTRYAVAASIVTRKHIVCAVSLLMSGTGIATVLGPLIGGILLEVIGASGSFALITVSFLLSFLLLLPMRIKEPKLPTDESLWQNLITGLQYVRSNKILLSLTLIAALVNLVVFPYWFTLVPIFAHDILHTSASGFGQLMAAIGLGVIIGSLIIGSLPQSVNKGRLLIAVVILWPVILSIFSASHLFLLSVVLLFFSGITQGMAMALIHSILLSNSSEEMRGRVSGIRASAIGTLPLGNLLTGYGASIISAPTMLIINSSVSIAITILVAIWATELFKNQ